MEPRGVTTAAAEIRRGRFAGPVFTSLVLLVGLIVIAVLHAELRANQRADAELAMDQRTTSARAAVQAETERYRSLIDATAAGLATDDHLTWDDFDAE
jgi:hypothetical protein